MFLPWSSDTIAQDVLQGTEKAVAFNQSLPLGIAPDKILKARPPVGAREWIHTDYGKELKAFLEKSLDPQYHGGKAFPLPAHAEASILIALRASYFSIDDRFKLTQGSRRRRKADNLANGPMRAHVWGCSRYSAKTRIHLAGLPSFYLVIDSLPISFSSASIHHARSGERIAGVTGRERLFRKLSEMSLRHLNRR